jgi:hypothetical protein
VLNIIQKHLKMKIPILQTGAFLFPLRRSLENVFFPSIFFDTTRGFVIRCLRRCCRGGISHDKENLISPLCKDISPLLLTCWRKHFFAFLLALVGASGLDMARLLALIADTLAFCFSWAITRNMADFAT